MKMKATGYRKARHERWMRKRHVAARVRTYACAARALRAAACQHAARYPKHVKMRTFYARRRAHMASPREVRNAQQNV